MGTRLSIGARLPATRTVTSTRISKTMVIVHGTEINTARLVINGDIVRKLGVPGSMRILRIKHIKVGASAQRASTLVVSDHGIFLLQVPDDEDDE